jgi:uncharacterized protein (DUF2336 family)
MNAAACAELISELEAAVARGSPERRNVILLRITHLFLSRADRLNEVQVGIFDDVLLRLISRAEPQSLIKLSSTLSESIAAPGKALHHLACHEDISIASPVLLRSRSLSDSELVIIARRLDREHLLAISQRPALSEAVTDSLVERGDIDIFRVLAKNAGAKLSKSGQTILVAAAERDLGIAESLGLRPDILPEIRRELLAKMSDSARLQLLKAAPATVRQSIREALDHIAAHISAKAPELIVYSDAESRVLALSKAGQLNDSTVNRFAVCREATNLIASLSLLSGAPIQAIEPLMEERDCHGLVVACRASRLNWQTTLAVIRSRSVPQPSEQELAQAKDEFERLHLSTAQRIARFELSTIPTAVNANAFATTGR